MKETHEVDVHDQAEGLPRLEGVLIFLFLLVLNRIGCGGLKRVSVFWLGHVRRLRIVLANILCQVLLIVPNLFGNFCSG